MTTPGERFQSWVDSLSAAWSERLGLWAGHFIAGGIAGILDMIATKASEQLSPMIKRLEDAGVPPELKPILDEVKKPTGEIAGLSGIAILGKVLGGIKADVWEYVTRSITHGMSYSADFYLPDANLLLDYYLRHIEPDITVLYDKMRSHGIPPEETDKLLVAKQLRFPSDIVGQLYLRDKEKYNKYWDDVAQLGVDVERIIALKELAYKIPGVQDIIRYVVKEAYSPEIYKAFGQDAEYPIIAEADAEKAGVRPDHLLKEWIAHWDLPSVGNGFEMLHRGEITQEQLSLLLKARDIMPFWRDKLTAISWSLPTRIEIRMMAQLGLVDKAFIMDMLEKDGLAEEYRSAVADMNIVRGIRSDIQTRYTKKWINKDEVKAEIDSYGLDPAVADRLYKWIVTNTAGDRTTAEKDLTAAEIIKGVKKGVLTWEEGVEQLMALGYDEIEADYKLTIDVEVTEAAPTSELNTAVDTIRRRRRQRLISRDEEITLFLDLEIEVGLATAYADNDDMRLVKVAVAKPPEVKLEYQTDDGKVKVETIRLSRRQQRISRDEEVMALMDLEMSDELAISIADNDDLRLAVVKPIVIPPVIPFYRTETGKVAVETIRLRTRQRLLTEELTPAQIAAGVVPRVLTGDEAKAMEITLLTRLEMDNELAMAYADNDELRLVKVPGGAT